MISPQEHPRLRSLLEKLCEEYISAAEAEELATVLRCDSQARRYYLRYIHLHAALGYAGARITSSALGVAAAQPFPNSRNLRRIVSDLIHRPTPVSVVVALAVIGILITAMAILTVPIYQRLARPTENVAEQVAYAARLSGVYSAVWETGADIRIGTGLPAGHSLRLAQGFAELTTMRGVRVVVEGPAWLTLNDDQSMQLRMGKLVARVPRRGQGFTVTTDHCRVVDLGTEFAVGLSPAGEMEIHVIQGKVELHTEGTTELLAAGNGVLVSPSGVMVERASDVAQFRRKLPTSKILWQGPFDMHGPADIATQGTPVVAVNAGGSAVTVSGVEFAASNPLGMSFAQGLNGHTTGDASLDALLSHVAFGGGQTIVLQFDGLQPGKKYLVQVFYCDGRAGLTHRPMILRDADNNQIALNNNSITADEPPFGQYALGTFTASSEIQRLTIESPVAAHVHLNGYLVRQINVEGL
jgi:hypothetical protein